MQAIGGCREPPGGAHADPPPMGVGVLRRYGEELGGVCAGLGGMRR